MPWRRDYDIEVNGGIIVVVWLLAILVWGWFFLSLLN